MDISYNITDDDFFKLLKVKFPLVYPKNSGSHVPQYSIFREHIDVLELLWEIQKNSGYREVGWSTDLPRWMANTTDQFNQLFQIKKPNIGIWGVREAIEFRCFIELAMLARDNRFKPNECTWEIFHFRSGANVNLVNLVFLIKKLCAGMFASFGYKAYTLQNSLKNSTQDAKYQDVFTVYKMYGSIFTTCLNFQFPNNNFLNFDMFAQQRLNDIDLIRKNIIERDPALVKAFYKLEEDGVGGLKFSCILLYAGAAKKSKQNLIRLITSKLKVFIIDYPIELQDWGVEIDQLAHQKVVGYINDEESLERFFYWTVSPYLQYDQFFKLRKQTNLNSTPKWVNDEFSSVYTVGMQDQLDDEHLRIGVKTFKNYSSSFNSIWCTGYLDKILQQKNKAALIYYRELRLVDDKGRQCDPDALYYLDIFIDTLAQQREPFFILTFGAQCGNKQIRVTRLGNQFLFLIEKFVPLGIEFFDALANYNQQLHGRFDLLLSSEIWSELRKIIVSGDVRLTVAKLKALNLARDKTAFASGIEHHRVRTSDYNAEVRIQKALYNIDQFAYYEHRTAGTKKYVQAFFKQDRLIARYQFYYDWQCSDRESLTVAFSASFTEFLRLNKRTELLKDLVGYFLVWLDDNQDKPYIDLIVILNCTDASFKNRINLAQKLDQAWAEFLLRRHLEIGPIQPNLISSQVKALPIMQSVSALNHESVVVETLNKILRKEIIDFLVPYFTYRHFFLPYHVEQNKNLPELKQKVKLFSRGAILKKKQPKPKVPKSSSVDT